MPLNLTAEQRAEHRRLGWAGFDALSRNEQREIFDLPNWALTIVEAGWLEARGHLPAVELLRKRLEKTS